MASIKPYPPTAMPAYSTLRTTKSTPLPPAALRQHARERFKAAVQVKLADGRLVEAHTLDISLGGVQLVLPVNLQQHSLCALRLCIPGIPLGVHVFMAQAEVASIVYSGREGGFVAGLRFTALPAASMAALQDYLQARDTQPARRNLLGGRGFNPASRVRFS